MNQEEILKSSLKIEEEHGLNKLTYEGFPVWSVLKYRLRGYHNVEMGITDITAHSPNHQTKLSILIKHQIRSLKNLFSLVKSHNKTPYCFVGFTRLEKINNIWIDKFVDPIISECNLFDDDFIYLNNETTHPQNRNQEHEIVYTDFINSLTIILVAMVFPILYLRNRKTLNIIKKVIKKYYTSNKAAIRYIYLKPAIIYVQSIIYKKIFKYLKTETLIGVARPSFFPQTLAAKKLGITAIEIQHGITHGLTNLYSGVYKETIDPDYFCTFGESCSPNVFNIPKSRIINIGFAFNSYLKKIAGTSEREKNCILVISEPQTSDAILSFILNLAIRNPEIQFNIRRHPREFYTETQKDSIKKHSNVEDVTSNECSQIAIMPYKFIIGDNSSVLFEALSIGKKVGRINCEGLEAAGYDAKKQDGFYYINNLNDFASFMQWNTPQHKTLEIYSDFDKEKFKKLISNNDVR